MNKSKSTASTESPIVIVGAGQCAVQAIDSLRRLGCRDPITLIGEDRELPYQRPPLSKKVLSGETDPESIFIEPPTYYKGHGVTLRLGVKAQYLDRDRSELELSNGQRLSYERLLLATGSRPRILSVPGFDLDQVFYLRTLNDALRLRPHLQEGQRLVIVGGGFIGLEAAAIARALGMHVTLLESAPRLLPRALSPILSDWLRRLHDNHRVTIKTGIEVVSIIGNRAVEGVECTTGTFPADVVLVAIGAVPNEELGADAGLEYNDGILVDRCCRTNDPRILAAGDCARFPSSFYDRTLRLESVQNAIFHGRIAAASLMDIETPPDEIPWFWTDQYDVKLQMAGLLEGHDDYVVRGCLERQEFSVFYLRNGKPIAADVVNKPREFMVCRQLIASNVAVNVQRLADSNTDLTSLLN